MKQAEYIEVSAGVRYWEDTTLNGEEDVDGKIPLRNGARWEPVVELATGRILDWPEGVEASIHYKVCDDGEYWLLDSLAKRVAKWSGYYVPNDILCVGDTGYGDYIIFDVGADGSIAGWERPEIYPEQWEQI